MSKHRTLRRSYADCIEYLGRTESNAWGNGDQAKNRALLEPSVTRENKKLFRTHHPSLGAARIVGIVKPQNKNKSFWFVDGFAQHLDETHAGGLEIHIAPPYTLANSILCFGSTRNVHEIQTRKLLSKDTIEEIRDIFSLACGIQIWISGFAVLLYKDQKTMDDCWRRGRPSRLGGLSVRTHVLNLEPSQNTVEAGNAITSTAGGRSSYSIGLRLRLLDGTQALTTATHGFVNELSPSAMFLSVFNWVLRFMHSLRGTNVNALLPVTPTTSRESNSSIGKLIFSAITNEPIGVITATYDQPSAWLPYPYGFRHDLSLITAHCERDIPQLGTAPDVPVPNSWGSVDDVLDGEPVFTISLSLQNFVLPRWHTDIGGVGSSRSKKKALVEGAQYLWTRDSTAFSTALLWRTTKYASYGDFDAAGFSDAVLCQGLCTDKTTRAVLFQSFQLRASTPMVETDMPHQYVKGGFLLPEEILQSTIECFENEKDPGRGIPLQAAEYH